MPETIHGYTIKAQFSTDAGMGHRAGRVLLVDRGEKQHQRWVSTWQGVGDVEWSQGHYFDKFEEARDHFLDTCKKEWLRAEQPPAQNNPDAPITPASDEVADRSSSRDVRHGCGAD